MLSAIGWAATAISAASYFFQRPGALRKTQAAAACLWMVYGLMLGAVPIVAANLIVCGAALWSSRRVAAIETTGAQLGASAAE